MQVISSAKGKTKQYHFSSPKGMIFLVGVVVCLLVINTSFLKIVMVNGSSMSPTLENGQIVLVKLNEKNICCGDIVVFSVKSFSDTQEFWIKRVIGIGGDVVEINYAENTVIVNNVLLREPYLNQEDDDPMWNTAGKESEMYTVPDDHLFIMGDNRNRSTDSRNIEVGYIPTDWIIGKVIGPPIQY